MKCQRNWNDCKPLANIVSDNETTFVCCGLSDADSRNVLNDCFRFCFVSETVDELSDNDEQDLLDMVAVITLAMSTKKRMPC